MTRPTDNYMGPFSGNAQGCFGFGAGSDSSRVSGDWELDAIFDSKHDGAFENNLRLLEGVLGGVVIRIGIVSGEYLVSRCENLSDPSVPANLLMAEYPCGVAIKNRTSMECRNLQKNPDFLHLPKVIEARVKHYSNQLICVKGGRVIGMICVYSRNEKTLTNLQRTQFAGLAKSIGHLIQNILDASERRNPIGGSVAPPPMMDMSSLFDLSPVPTGVMTYPEFDYVAANEPMSRELGVFFNRAESSKHSDCRAWVPNFYLGMEENGQVEGFELEVNTPEGGTRHFVLDGRFLISDGRKNVLISARDVTRERAREHKMKLLLEVTNAEIGDNWFRRSAEAFAEIANVEFLAIAEFNNERGIESHAVWKQGAFWENFVIDASEFRFEDLCQRESLVASSIPGDCPLRVFGVNFLRGLPVIGHTGRPIGLVILGSEKKVRIDTDTSVICEIFATRIAAEIARVNYDEAREAELRRISMLQRISQAISKCTDPDRLLNIAAEEIGEIFGVSRCVIHRKKTGGGFPIVAEYVKEPFSSMLGVRVPRSGNKHAENVMLSDDVVAVSDVFEDPQFESTTEILEKFEIRSMMSARTSFENDANGAIGLQQCGAKVRVWTEDEKHLLGTLVANIGVAIAQADMTERDKQQRFQIEAALRKAEAGSKAKSEFLARMSHELRTPMNSILGFSQLLSADQELTDGQRDTLSIVNRSGEHLMLLINDVLEMSKIESGKQDVNLSVFSPRKLIKGLSELFAIRADSKGLTLRTHLEAGLPDRVEGDENKLRQVITNLVGNAIKFTFDGEVKVNCWYLNNDIENTNCGKLAFSIEDTGCGMSAEEQAALFTPFVQADAGIKSSEGTGLGLAISKSFVELLGGDLKVVSARGAGSKFSFSITCREVTADNSSAKMAVHNLPKSLPYASRNPSGSSQSKISDLRGKGKPTVIVADDQPENRLLVVKLLGTLGYTLVEAVDGQDAIDACKRCKPDIILMDVRMPGTDGLTATRRIREMSEFDKQPFIIALTGNAFDEDRKIAKAAGCDEFLAKPFRLDDLLEMLLQKSSETETSQAASDASV